MKDEAENFFIVYIYLSPSSAIINLFATENEVEGQGTMQSVYACCCIVYIFFFCYFLSSDEIVPLFLTIYYWERCFTLRETGNMQGECTAKNKPLEAFSMTGE